MSKGRRHIEPEELGGWRSAMADFCLSMMTLFMMLWVVAVADDTQRDALSDFFNAVDDSEEHQSSDPDDYSVSTMDFLEPHDEDEEEIDPFVLQILQMTDFEDNLRMEGTDDGLLLQLIDTDDQPMFRLGEYELLPEFEKILEELGAIVINSVHDISIVGHTDALPFSDGSHLNNWTLSYARANTVREKLQSLGMDQERIVTVSGMADSRLLDEQNPVAAANRRVEMVLMMPVESRFLEHQLQLRREFLRVER